MNQTASDSAAQLFKCYFRVYHDDNRTQLYDYLNVKSVQSTNYIYEYVQRK